MRGCIGGPGSEFGERLVRGPVIRKRQAGCGKKPFRAPRRNTGSGGRGG